MKSKLITLMVLSAVLAAGSVQSRAKGPDHSSRPKSAPVNSDRIKEQNLARDMVQFARVRYEAGNFEAANKILQATLEIDPRCHAGWYYLHLVQKAMNTKKPSDNSVRPWYPTMPPRPIRE
jgi:Tfp pilus assembly protein PilF